MARSGSKRLFTAEMRLLNKLETMSDMVALPTDMPTDPNGAAGGADISSLGPLPQPHSQHSHCKTWEPPR